MSTLLSFVWKTYDTLLFADDARALPVSRRAARHMHTGIWIAALQEKIATCGLYFILRFLHYYVSMIQWLVVVNVLWITVPVTRYMQSEWTISRTRC